MPTHDYILDNATGAAFRSDLNNALAAIVSQNSSATAPATTYAYMPWADTTAGVMKMRNGANNGWIELFELDGEFGSKTFNGNVTLNAQGDLRFADADSSNYVAFQAPATVATNIIWTLPTTDGTATQALVTDGGSVLSWATFAALSTAQSFTAAQRGTISVLTSASTVTPNFAVANNFSLTLGHTVTLANPTNLTAGQSGAIFITQGAGTAYTMSFGSYWDFSGGTAPTVTPTLSAVDCLVYTVRSATSIHAQLITNLS